MTLLLIDILAALFVLVGFQLAFRQKALRAWIGVRSGRRPAPSSSGKAGDDGVDSVLRMVGVMIMAFGVTGCTFANLISYYASQSAN